MRAFHHLAVAQMVFAIVLLDQIRAASAQVEDGHAAARALAREGADLYEKDDFRGALDKFKQAHDQFPSPKLFFNIAQTLRGLDRNVEALTAYERFLAEATDASVDHRERAAVQVAELNRKVGRVAVESDRPGAIVTVDGRTMGAVPLGKPVVLDPGSHQLTVTFEGESRSLAIAVLAGQRISRTLNFEKRKPSFEPAAPALESGAPRIPNVQAQPSPAGDKQLESSHAWYWIVGGAVIAARRCSGEGRRAGRLPG